MKYTEEMILHSDSGYCMPFEEPQGKDVELSLGYGEQTHPETGEKFFHHGIDFNVRCHILSAVAGGIVSGVGNDPVHGICQTIRYGEYEVIYGHLSNVYAQFGQRVKAGQTVALSGERLHMEVRFKGEELNILIGSEAVADEEIKEKVKLQTMILLNEKYGITEKDFTRAELEIVPATPARDIGFDRSMVGGYGQDDRVDAYAALVAEIEVKDPAFTTVCVLADKEEIGSYGITGMGSTYTFDWLRQLCRMQGADEIRAFRASLCLSADVTAAYDPTWASAFEPQNGTYAGRGVAFFKYTGSRGKSGANDASAEQMGRRRRGLADRRAGPHRPGRRRHRGHRGGPQRHRRGGHRGAGAVHALAL